MIPARVIRRRFGSLEWPLMLYRCLVKYGHAGSGHYTERSILVRASTALEAMDKAKRRKGVKKGRLMRTGGSVLSVERADMRPAS